jgi:hypothetical protein
MPRGQGSRTLDTDLAETGVELVFDGPEHAERDVLPLQRLSYPETDPHEGRLS